MSAVEAFLCAETKIGSGSCILSHRGQLHSFKCFHNLHASIIQIEA